MEGIKQGWKKRISWLLIAITVVVVYKMLDNLDKQGGKFLLTNVLRNGDEVNTYLLNFSKKYKTINTNEVFINKNYQKKNHSLEILVKNY